MAKQTKAGSAKEPVPKKEKTDVFNGDILQGEYDETYLKRVGLYERTLLRKLRYWCYKIHFAKTKEKKVPETCPKGLQKYVESLPGFAGWEYFAHTWDVIGENPFKIVLRLQSVWDEWDQVMNRVAIPIDAPPAQISARLKALEDDYARTQAKKK